jgi:hypothetical protein
MSTPPIYSEQVDSDLHRLYAIYSKPICQVRLHRLQQADLRQVGVRLYTSLGIDASSATPRQPRRIVFTNIIRGHHRRQPSTSTNSIMSSPSPTVVIVNANKIFFFSY